MWIPLMDYAVKKNVSLSTLRRYIKSNKIQFKVENGKYLVYCAESSFIVSDDRSPSQIAQAAEQAKSMANHDLERELKMAQEEIAELKMLIALYEEKMLPNSLNV